MKFKELTESSHKCPHCGGPIFSEMMMMEKKDACYYKVKAGAKVWPSAYASGRLVQCRKKGAANYGNKSEGKINEFAPPGGDDRGPNDEEILRRLAAQWWSGTEQQMIKAQQTLEALGWEIGPDESGNDDAGVYVYRIGDNDGRDTLAFGHGELSLDEGVAKDDNSDVADISDSDYMRIKGIVDKKYPGYELASLNIGRDGYIEIEIYNYKTHDTKHLKTKSTSENKQGVAEGIRVVDQDYDLDQIVLTIDIEGKRASFTYTDYDENFKNAERRDVFDQLQEKPWYKGLDHPTKMEILDAAYRAIRGLEPQEYRPTVGDEPLDEQGVAEEQVEESTQKQ